MATEIRILKELGFDIQYISQNRPDCPGERVEHECVFLDTPADSIVSLVREFDPQVIHTHWIGGHLDAVFEAARELDIPFTVRGHSFDSLWEWDNSIGNRLRYRRWKVAPPAFQDQVAKLDSEYCLGALLFPFGIERYIDAGVRRDKLHPCFPMLDFERFHYRGDHGNAILNQGACLPKKDFGQYVRLASRCPDLAFDLYSIGYQTAETARYNATLGGPVNLRQPVAHERMPAVYRNSRWLVYTADRALNTVGWPVCVAEAMASGVGVCMPNLRPDLADYVGAAAYLYNSIDELPQIISGAVPEDMRTAGFEQARKSDARIHIRQLLDLWRPAVSI